MDIDLVFEEWNDKVETLVLSTSRWGMRYVLLKTITSAWNHSISSYCKRTTICVQQLLLYTYVCQASPSITRTHYLGPNTYSGLNLYALVLRIILSTYWWHLLSNITDCPIVLGNWVSLNDACYSGKPIVHATSAAMIITITLNQIRTRRETQTDIITKSDTAPTGISSANAQTIPILILPSSH